MLLLANGRRFCTGTAPITIGPATLQERTNRAFITIEVDGFQTTAIIDTGGVWFIVNHEVASAIGLQPSSQLSSEVIKWRGISVAGFLDRIGIRIHASKGEGLALEATAFVPSRDQEGISDLPCMLGYHGCLDRLRFAIDPDKELFYFGPIP